MLNGRSHDWIQRAQRRSHRRPAAYTIPRLIRSDYRARDAQCQKDWESLARPWQKMRQGAKGSGHYQLEQDPRIKDFRWQLEELRVALFAQELRTPTPMSVKRLEKVLASLR